MTAVEFFISEGIDLRQAGMFAVVDGYMRRIDICLLMEKYAKQITPEKIPSDKTPGYYPDRANFIEGLEKKKDNPDITDYSENKV